METTDTLVRAARELLRWDQKRLAEEAKIGIATLRRFETGAQVEAQTVEAIEYALQEAGIAFLGPDNPDASIKHGVGVTLKGRPLARPETRVYRTRKKPGDSDTT